MSDIITSETRAEYWRDVDTIASEILAQHYGDHNAICEAVHEHVDGSAWIIYTGQQLAVLMLTLNDPDGGEVAAMSDGSWQNMQTVAAFLAMEGDVWEAIRSKEEDADTECPDCEGDGFIECPDCGSEEICETWDATRTIDCPRCEGTGEINPFSRKE